MPYRPRFVWRKPGGIGSRPGGSFGGFGRLRSHDSPYLAKPRCPGKLELKGNDEERLRREIEALKEQKALMEMWPEMDLPDRTKKLRQACFKANFTKRRIMGAP
ncbi:Protein RKD4 [Acorus calamus]|uniref:Protein RKD4 n=1 Tax=Acorus calamus TaxID=4465 RepID=A0AAV9FLK9_ACOCL|nr:Protein RKD4 [Acorus calamus]